MIKILLHFIFSFLYLSALAQSDYINEASKTITKNALYETIFFLASDTMKGRNTGTKEIDSAAQYIANKFEEAGLFSIAENNDYFQDFIITTSKGGVKATNVMGVIPRKDTTQDSIVIISAHYDHIGNGNNGAMKTNVSDSIYNGANDNASGVASLIEIAKYYTLLNENKYAIVFIAFTAEEWGLVGSRYESGLLNSSLIKAVINLDMIGRPINKRFQKCMVVTNNSGPIIKKLNKTLQTTKKYFIEDQYPLENLNLRADHASFPNCKNAFTLICTSPKDEFYHAPDDTIDTIDFPFLLKTTINIAEACRAFIK
jgi:Zn-dependent M28 family amino/carboxypeptidase